MDQKKTFVFLFVFFSSVIIGWSYYNIQNQGGQLIRSQINHKEYFVKLGDPDSADLLAQIEKNIDSLKQILQSEHPDDERTHLLLSRYKGNVVENIHESQHTSYSVNKGELLVLCIRDRKPQPSLHSLNTMMFVVLHEIAHVVTHSVGHTKEFWDNFRWLLQIAIKHDLYQYVNYSEQQENYCGLEINDTPLKL